MQRDGRMAAILKAGGIIAADSPIPCWAVSNFKVPCAFRRTRTGALTAALKLRDV
jgi:hypothetical protein